METRWVPNQDAVLKVMDEAAPTVRNALAKHAYLTCREENGRRIMEILAAPGEQALLSLAAEPDGTITATRNGEPDPNIILNAKRTSTETQAAAAVAALIMEETLKALAGNPIAPETLSGEQARKRLEHAANDIVQDTQTRNSIPAWMMARRSTFNYQETKLIAYNFLGRYENWLLLERVFDGYDHGYTVAQYNTIARNGPVFRRMEERDSPPLHFYCNRIAPYEKEPRTFAHPGEVIDAVRNTLELPPRLWSIFAKIPHSCWPEGGNLLQEVARDRNEVTTRDAVTKGSILAMANTPNNDRTSLKHAVRVLIRNIISAGAPWSHGNPMEAWANLARAYLPLDIDRHAMWTPPPDLALTRIADALRGSINNGQPWGRGNWETLNRRSERWHQAILENARRESEIRRETLAQKTWHSAIETVELQPFTFTAVTSGGALADLGVRMNNCLSTFANDCADGHCRIFTAHRGASSPPPWNSTCRTGNGCPAKPKHPATEHPQRASPKDIKNCPPYTRKPKPRTRGAPPGNAD